MNNPSEPDYIRDPDRLEALRATGLLESASEPSFDELARLAQRLLNAPLAMVTLVAEDRQITKSRAGDLPGLYPPQREVALSYSYCQHAVRAGQPLIINDTTQHELVQYSPSTTDLGIRAYAGIPLTDGRGHVLGAVCVLDDHARQWDATQIATLQAIAEAASASIARGVARTASADPQTARVLHEIVRVGDQLFARANELMRAIDAYEESLTHLDEAGLLTREAAAQEQVLASEARLSDVLATFSFPTTSGEQGMAVRAAAQLQRAVQEYLDAKAGRAAAIAQLQRGERGLAEIDREVQRTSAAEKKLRLALQAYVME